MTVKQPSQRRRLTPSDAVRVRILHGNGTSIRRLEMMFHVSYETIKRAVDPEYAELRRQDARNIRAARGAKHHIAAARVVAPDDVMIDRDRRASAPVSITAEFCGDPKPGQSALDKKRNELAP